MKGKRIWKVLIVMVGLLLMTRGWNICAAETQYFETESNNSYQTANQITCNSVVNGNISQSSDKDYYIIELEGAGKVDMSFQHTKIR